MTGQFRFLDATFRGAPLEASYDPALVVLSYGIAAFAALTALILAGRVVEFRKERLKAAMWLFGGALAMGTGIWTMHFVAMLAYRLPIPVFYDVATTAVSLIVAIAISGFALVVVTRANLSWASLVVGGTVMGIGVGAMHYTGMAAMRLDALMFYRPWPFALSVVNAVVCSTIALGLMFRLQRARALAKIGAGLVMGAAIAGMHYLGMYGTVCVATGVWTSATTSLDPTVLATLLGGATLLIMGVALVLSLQSQLQSRKLREQNALLKAEIEQRRKAEAALQEQRDHLQQLVEARTIDLAAAKDAAEQANAAKSMFLANMSHELRAPMQAILGFARLGHTKAQDPKMIGYFERIRTSGERLLLMLNDLLDLSKLEAGHMSMQFRAERLRALLDAVVLEMEPLMAARNLFLSIEEAPDLPYARVDAPRVSQIIRNLLSNAIKFSPAGGTIRVRLSEGEHERLVLSIGDDGMGIPEGELEAVFDKFVQSSKTHASAGGTGLGLAISREIANGHGGRIFARNGAKGSAEFVVELPVASEKSPELAAA